MTEATRKSEFPDDGGLAKRIREARLAAGLTLETVAWGLSITDSAIAQWESGRTRPSRQRLAEFCQFVGRDPVWLQTGVEPANDTQRAHPLLVPKLSWSRAAQELPLKWEPSDLGHDAIQPHHPCSERAFALQMSEPANNEILFGDILIVDPAINPRFMDSVAVVREGKRRVEIGMYLASPAITEIDSVRVQLREMMDELLRSPEKNTDTAFVAAARDLSLRLKKMEDEQVRTFDLALDNLTTRISVEPRSAAARIVGVMTEHSKRRRP